MTLNKNKKSGNPKIFRLKSNNFREKNPKQIWKKTKKITTNPKQYKEIQKNANPYLVFQTVKIFQRNTPRGEVVHIFCDGDDEDKSGIPAVGLFWTTGGRRSSGHWRARSDSAGLHLLSSKARETWCEERGQFHFFASHPNNTVSWKTKQQRWVALLISPKARETWAGEKWQYPWDQFLFLGFSSKRYRILKDTAGHNINNATNATTQSHNHYMTKRSLFHQGRVGGREHHWIHQLKN